MTRKSVILPHQVFSNVSMAIADSISDPTSIQYTDNAAYQVKWSGSDAIGLITVECSVNYEDVHKTGDWEALTFDPELTQPNSDSGSYLINLNQLPFPWVRLRYTRGAGGTESVLNAWVSVKEI